MSFTAATPQGKNHTKSDIWITPQFIVDGIGISDLDPCAFLVNGKPIVKTAYNYYTEKDNGLVQPWDDFGSIFVNFPYSEPLPWIERCIWYSTKGLEIIILCFNRSDTKWSQLALRHATGINMVKGRLSFINSEGLVQSNGNAPSMLIAYGKNAYKRIKNIQGVCAKIDR